MAKQIRLNAFDMNCAGHLSPGLWTHPRDRSTTYKDLDYWSTLARTLERGKFDGLFLADVLGVYDVFGGNADAALASGAQVPLNDPSLVIPAMAQVTEHLGFGVTCTLSYEPPYTFARRMSTLDHLTKGRVGWNIVTGYLNSAAKGLGLSAQGEHDRRYDIADEYMEVVYKLWEGSWEDDAVVLDRERRIFVDPAKVHKIVHHGEHYNLDAIHLSEPSLQRTPVLYQAGASTRGREFAARHAECVFMGGYSKTGVGSLVADLRARARSHGRDPAEILVFSRATVIPGRTEAEAQAKLQDYRSHVSYEGALALLSGWTGIDLSRYAPDEPLRPEKNDAIHSAVEALAGARADRVWTVRDLALATGIGGGLPLFVGTPEQVVDGLLDWVTATDVDGFNLSYVVTPESFVDFVELVVPELQRRGRYKLDYERGTLREKLSGRARLPAHHPAAAHRWPRSEAAVLVDRAGAVPA
jgi:FMN-dependent oxidoreductase (nitrilotriacetate monooxygenase family)